jgi:hypothetical protein
MNLWVHRTVDIMKERRLDIFELGEIKWIYYIATKFIWNISKTAKTGALTISML